MTPPVASRGQRSWRQFKHLLPFTTDGPGRATVTLTLTLTPTLTLTLVLTLTPILTLTQTLAHTQTLIPTLPLAPNRRFRTKSDLALVREEERLAKMSTPRQDAVGVGPNTPKVCS